MGVEAITKDTIKGAAIRELQGLKLQVVAGDSAATNIPLMGATVAKTTIVGVIEHDPVTPVIVDRTSEASITSDGNLQLDTTDTTGSQLAVLTYNKP